MANTIRTKRSITPSAVPPALLTGELAVNLVDKKLFVGGMNGSIIDLLSSCQSSNNDVAHVVDKRPIGEDGGTNRKKKWNVRTLTSIEHDTSSLVQLMGDDFRLAAGTYLIDISAPVEEVKEHKLRIWDETNDILVAEGGNHMAEEYDSAKLTCVITSDGTIDYEIQHYTEEREKKHGLGKAMNVGSFEIYTTMTIIRIS